MSPPPDEKRRHTRAPVARRGVVVGGDGKGHPCLIIDLSIGGARVELIPQGSPEEPMTLIDRAAGTSHDLKIVWRRGPILGAAFSSTTELPA